MGRMKSEFHNWGFREAFVNEMSCLLIETLLSEGNVPSGKEETRKK
jgi:hypothetical protein